MGKKMKNALTIVSMIVCTILILGFSAGVLYNWLVLKSEITMDVATIVSIVLAFFSIIISMMFYFKATETSNKFYDNSLNHMSKQSELLGRIEERFGEKFNTVEATLKGLTGIKRELQHSSKAISEVQSDEVEDMVQAIKSSDIPQDLKERLKAQLAEKDNIINNYQDKISAMTANIDKLIYKTEMNSDCYRSGNDELFFSFGDKHYNTKQIILNTFRIHEIYFNKSKLNSLWGLLLQELDLADDIPDFFEYGVPTIVVGFVKKNAIIDSDTEIEMLKDLEKNFKHVW